MIELIPLSSAKADHYAKLRARLAVQKASEHEAIAAIDELCHDNERLDLRSQASVAAALEAAAAKLQNVADNWDCGHNESRLCDCAPYAEQWGLAADETRALITPNQRTALQAAIDAEVAEARAGDAELISASLALKEIVEGVSGAMDHGTFRAEKGMRLKDTPEWVAFYVAISQIGAKP